MLIYININDHTTQAHAINKFTLKIYVSAVLVNTVQDIRETCREVGLTAYMTITLNNTKISCQARPTQRLRQIIIINKIVGSHLILI